jgi:NtrC-family two-component system sensor histidine kinase KinB
LRALPRLGYDAAAVIEAMKWSLHGKVLAGYAPSFLLTAAVLAWAVSGLVRLGRAIDDILRENYNSIVAAQAMIEAADRQEIALLVWFSGDVQRGRGQFDSARADFLQWLARAKDNVTISGEGQVVDKVEAAARAVEARAEAILRSAGPSAEPRPAMPSYAEVRDAARRLLEANQAAMNESSRSAQRIAARAVVSMVVVGGSALLVGLAFSIVLSRLVVKPLYALIAATARIAEGSYDVRVPGESADELGRLAQGFNAMVSRLQAYHAMNVDRLLAEQRKSEAVIAAIDDGIVLVDEEMRVAAMNPAAEQALGARLRPGSAPHVLELIDDRRLVGRLRETAEKRQHVASGEDELLTLGSGQASRHYQYSITPISSGERRPGGVVLLLRDVTKLKELDRLKSEFVAIASHELRTPLTTVEMAVALLGERHGAALPDKDRELLQAAGEETRRLRALVNDLLDLSKIESGRIEMEMASFSLQELLEQARQVIQKQADDAGVSLEVRPDAARVRADGNKIVWVLTNLVSNALRHTPAGGRVTLSASRSGDVAYVSVADTGTGIPREYHGRIFDKFVRVKGDTAPRGTGLGLAICREVVRAHGGAIWVESEPGLGSTFTFTLSCVGEQTPRAG